MARLSSEQTRDVIHKVVRLFFDLLQETISSLMVTGILS